MEGGFFIGIVVLVRQVREMAPSLYPHNEAFLSSSLPPIVFPDLLESLPRRSAPWVCTRGNRFLHKLRAQQSGATGSLKGEAGAFP